MLFINHLTVPFAPFCTLLHSTNFQEINCQKNTMWILVIFSSIICLTLSGPGTLTGPALNVRYSIFMNSGEFCNQSGF